MEKKDNDGLKALLASALVVIGMGILYIYGSSGDNYLILIAAAFLSVGQLLSSYYLVRTAAPQLAKMAIATGMAMAAVVVIAQTMKIVAAPILVDGLIVTTCAFLILDVALAIASTFGNPYLELR